MRPIANVAPNDIFDFIDDRDRTLLPNLITPRSHSIPFNLTLTRLPSAQAKLIALSPFNLTQTAIAFGTSEADRTLLPNLITPAIAQSAFNPITKRIPS
ncbi:hypothetical protein [Coleofasciculus sp. F4-SAH-05]|uniref:hypothetical protein n=1 Tax=Coleofasciculus sp. F4-SAH-05 TaxID=3069525 RepID=UPI0040627F7F